MKRFLAALAFVVCPVAVLAQVVPGHRLPEGPERPVRERTFHAKKYKADLRFDMAAERIDGNRHRDLRGSSGAPRRTSRSMPRTST